jgi:hypothetical protein
VWRKPSKNRSPRGEKGRERKREEALRTHGNTKIRRVALFHCLPFSKREWKSFPLTFSRFCVVYKQILPGKEGDGCLEA